MANADGMDSADGVTTFYDELAATYDRIYADWPGSIRRQGAALQRIVAGELGAAGPHRILDCAVGIGTQLLGLAAYGHDLTGSDLSRGAVHRAAAETAGRGIRAGLLVADMRSLPFRDDRFDVVVCADNSLPHLLGSDDVVRALEQMYRVVRPGGLVLVSTRDYDAARADRPRILQPQLSDDPDGATVTVQLWRWHDDGERYDLRHLQVSEAAGAWVVAERRAVYWAITRAELAGLATEAGLLGPRWAEPRDTGFFQPLLVGRVPAPPR
jgi:ubiquinone/menaquinone biosynthesis C-methylase UbiE